MPLEEADGVGAIRKPETTKFSSSRLSQALPGANTYVPRGCRKVSANALHAPPVTLNRRPSKATFLTEHADALNGHSQGCRFVRIDWFQAVFTNRIAAE